MVSGEVSNVRSQGQTKHTTTVGRIALLPISRFLTCFIWAIVFSIGNPLGEPSKKPAPSLNWEGLSGCIFSIIRTRARADNRRKLYVI